MPIYGLIGPGPGYQQPKPDPALQQAARDKFLAQQQKEQMLLQAQIKAEQDARQAAIQAQRDQQMGAREYDMANLGAYNRYLQSAWDTKWQEERDARQAQQRAQEQERGADLQAKLNATQLGQAEQMRMHRLQQAASAISANPDLSDEEKQMLLTQVHTGLNPLQNRHTQSQMYAQQIQSQAMIQQTEQQATLFNQQQEWLARGAQASIITLNDPVTGEPSHFTRDARGNLTPIDFSLNRRTEESHQMGMARGGVDIARGVQGIRQNEELFPLQREALSLSNQSVRQNVNHLSQMNPLQVEQLRQAVAFGPARFESEQAHRDASTALMYLDALQRPEQHAANMAREAQNLAQGAEAFPSQQAYRDAQTRYAQAHAAQIEATLEPEYQETERLMREGRLDELTARARLETARANVMDASLQQAGTLTPAQANALTSRYERETSHEVNTAAARLRGTGGRPDTPPSRENNWGLPAWASDSARSIAQMILNDTNARPDLIQSRRDLLNHVVEQDRLREVTRRRTDHYNSLIQDGIIRPNAPAPQQRRGVGGGVGGIPQGGAMPTGFGNVPVGGRSPESPQAQGGAADAQQAALDRVMERAGRPFEIGVGAPQARQQGEEATPEGRAAIRGRAEQERRQAVDFLLDRGFMSPWFTTTSFGTREEAERFYDNADSELRSRILRQRSSRGR